MMQILAYLIPISLLLGGFGLVAFIYTVRSDQYDDPEGNARRILSDEWDDHPKP
jgi:cbb3-type cytochrome oxidase maturation protein